MLEGKELEYKIGDFGSASLDLSDKGIVELSVGVKIDLVAEIEKLAAKTATPIDDSIAAFLKKLVGKADAPELPPAA